MPLFDYHVHSKHSPDSETELEAILEAAKARGIAEIAVTDHCDATDGETHWETPYDPAEALADHRRAAAENTTGVTMVHGLELGQATQDKALADRVLAEGEFDFVIGSYHNLSKHPDFFFLEYPDDAACRRYIGQYLVELLDMVKWGRFDVVGHLTLPVRYMAMAGRTVDFSGFPDEVDTVLKTLVESGKGIELNVSALNYGTGPLLPDEPILRRYRELGGEIITTGSDGHVPEHVGGGIAKGTALLKQIGFRYVATFRERKPAFVPID